MSRKTPPFENYPAWTTARFFGFLRSLLRQGFNRYPPKYETLQAASSIKAVLDEDGNPVTYKTGKKKGKPKYHKRYTCNKCQHEFPQKDVQVDHIRPAGSLQCFADLPAFAGRLFCGVDGLQVLCSTCHKEKTEKEKQRRGTED